MKAKTLTKAKKGKKSYTTSEIREAIAYWKGRLASLSESLNEEDEKPESDVDDVDDGGNGKGNGKGKAGLPDEKTVREKAKSTPVGAFNPNRRFYRMHLAAVKKVKAKLAKLLHDKGLSVDEDSNIQIENSAIQNDDFDPEVGNALVTIKVTVEKAQLKGLRKLFAALFEDEHAFDGIDEGKIWNAVKAGFKGVKDAGIEKIADANEKLRQNIGVPAMHEYFQAFFGKILAAKVTKKNVFAGGDDKSVEGAEFVYCASANIKF